MGQIFRTEPSLWRTALLASFLLAPVHGLPATTADAGRITNFSARAIAGSGDQMLTVGFVVSGDGNTFLLRGVGPTLGSYGVTGALADPRLTLFSGNTALISNDNWGGAFIAPPVGAFGLATNSLDAAILAALNRGTYTAQVGTNGGANGVALAEIYDTQTSSARLMNLSVRAPVGTGQGTFYTGFVIGGPSPRTIMLRAVGPTLASFGLTGAVADPKLELFETGIPTPFSVNEAWGNSSPVRMAAAQAGAFPLAGDAKDSAMLLTLPPGSYTAKISSASGGSGVALLEMYDQPVSLFPLNGASNVIYQHGDVLKYSNVGEYLHADGSRTLITGGWLRLEVLDEGLRNPFNGNLPVLSLVETMLYVGAYVAPNGFSMPVRMVGFPTTRYFVQDAYGTVKYQGDRLPEGTDSTGAPVFHTYWFVTPLDYIQYAAPFAVGTVRTTPYLRRDPVANLQRLGTTVTNVEAIDTVATPLGNFASYRVRYTETSNDPGTEGAPVASRMQYVYPDLGIIRFDFSSLTPGDTGVNTMALTETNLPYLGGSNYTLATGNVLQPIAAGQYSRFDRSGYYLSNDGTVEEISGWFTREVMDENVVNPATSRKVLTVLETHDTQIEATTLQGGVTRTSSRQVLRRYVEISAQGETIFVGDTGGDGSPVWFDQGFVPMPWPYSVGQTHSQTITASTWKNSQPTTVSTYTPTMNVLSKVPVRAKLGTFETYRMTYSDTTGRRAEQYAYPKIGVVKFSYPAPTGKMGHMDLTLSSTNVSFQ